MSTSSERGAGELDQPSSTKERNLYQFSGDNPAAQPQEKSSLDYYRFSGDGPDKTPQGQTEATGTPEKLRSDAQSVLQDDKASSQDKLKVVEKLLASGVDRLEIRDRDGQTRSLRLEVCYAGSKAMIHAFTDEGGKERVLLRGISNGDGTFTQEKDKSGRSVGFYGDWWTKNMSDRSNFSDSKQALAQPNPEQANRQSTGEQPYLRPVSDQAVPRQQTAWSSFDGYNHPERQQYRQIPDMRDTTSGYERVQPSNYSDISGPAALDQRYLNQMFDNARINGIHNGRRPVYFRAGMTIDADGSPRARQIDPTGQLNTSLRHRDGRPVNAETVPYFVLPGGQYKHLGIKLGDMAAVRYNGKVAFAVFADVGPRHKLGEGSMALAQELGINHNPRNGGVRGGVEYMVFPGSGNGTPGDHQRNHFAGARILQNAAGDVQRQRPTRRYV